MRWTWHVAQAVVCPEPTSCAGRGAEASLRASAGRSSRRADPSWRPRETRVGSPISCLRRPKGGSNFAANNYKLHVTAAANTNITLDRKYMIYFCLSKYPRFANRNTIWRVFATMTVQVDRIQLPQEIIDQVIDHLHDDLSSLRVCTLVRTSWLPSSSLHLFRCVRWPPCPYLWDDPRGSIEECRCPKKGNSSWTEELMSVFTSSREIGRYVRELYLSLGWYWQTHPDRFHPTVRDAGRLRWQDLLKIIDAMPLLKDLNIRALRLRPPSPGDQPSRTISRSLHGLTLNSPMRHLDLGSLGYFLRSFDHIKNLVVDDFRSPQPLTQYISGPVPSVDSVTVVHALGNASPYLQAIRHNLGCSSIRFLFLVDIPFGDPEFVALEDILRASPNLATIISDSTPYDIFLRMSFPCSSLREFRTFGYCMFNGSGISFTSWDNIWAVFASPMMSNVDSLSIKFSMGKIDNDDPEMPDDAEREIELALRLLNWTSANCAASRLRHFALHIELDVTSRFWIGDQNECVARIKTTIEDQATSRLRDVLKLVVEHAL